MHFLLEYSAYITLFINAGIYINAIMSSTKKGSNILKNYLLSVFYRLYSFIGKQYKTESMVQNSIEIKMVKGLKKKAPVEESI